ncbi:unnamed protein product, partial [Ectocarpus sp. 12 AP-2014]
LSTRKLYLLQAYAGEIKLWLSLLPVAVERARESYAHAEDCTYSRTSHDSAPVLCKCGMGKDLPPAFVEALKSGNVNGEKCFYRAALSPLYTTNASTSSAPQTKKNARMTVASGSAGCSNCGKDGSLRPCSRCHQVRYCSRDCQRQHWKDHKRDCG